MPLAPELLYLPFPSRFPGSGTYGHSRCCARDALDLLCQSRDISRHNAVW